MTGVRAVVEGRVQGVGFRWFVRQEARRLGVAGWVRNLRDGSVEAVLIGAPDAVQAMLDAIGRGPGGAHVDEVITRPALAAEIRAARTPFEVRRTE